MNLRSMNVTASFCSDSYAHQIANRTSKPTGKPFHGTVMIFVSNLDFQNACIFVCFLLSDHTGVDVLSVTTTMIGDAMLVHLLYLEK